VQISKNLGIVIVERDKDTQELYNLYLKKLGIREDRIMVAESGKECMEIFENKKQIENEDDILVILDMHLKDMSSLHVAKEIMNMNPQQKMILTTTSTKEVKNYIKNVSTSTIEDDMILIKPFRFSQLLSLIKTLTAN
jgi:DNA-binding response OmpR family regulator